MDVRVLEPGSSLSREVEHVGLRTDELAVRRVIADGDDPPVLHGDGRGARARRVHGVDGAVHEREIGRPSRSIAAQAATRSRRSSLQ